MTLVSLACSYLCVVFSRVTKGIVKINRNLCYSVLVTRPDDDMDSTSALLRFFFLSCEQRSLYHQTDFFFIFWGGRFGVALPKKKQKKKCTSTSEVRS